MTKVKYSEVALPVTWLPGHKDPADTSRVNDAGRWGDDVRAWPLGSNEAAVTRASCLLQPPA